MKARHVPLLLISVALLLLFWAVPVSACSTSCADGSFCDTNIGGGMCTCSCGTACCGRVCPLCQESSVVELDFFKARIDEWAASDRPEVRALSEVGANLYTAVLLHDHDAYQKAIKEYNQQLRLLSPEDRREVNSGPRH
jgi:hypothetical protein